MHGNCGHCPPKPAHALETPQVNTHLPHPRAHRRQRTQSSTANAQKEVLHTGDTSENSRGIQSTRKKHKILYHDGEFLRAHSSIQNSPPPTTFIFSIRCKLLLVMRLPLNAQMCARANITSAQITKQYIPPTYINIQMHPNKIKSA